MLISDGDLMEIIKSQINKINKEIKSSQGTIPELKVEALEEIEKFIILCQKESQAESKQYFSRQLSLAYIGIMTTGILSILIKNEEEEILRDWLKREINPNIVLGNFLTQITNSVLAAVRLVEDV